MDSIDNNLLHHSTTTTTTTITTRRRSFIYILTIFLPFRSSLTDRSQMSPHFLWCLMLLPAALLSFIQPSQSLVSNGEEKSAVFLSPVFVQGPGSVQNKFYYDVDFPRGHIAIKDLSAQVVDELGNPVPLHETYLHHWLLMRYYGLKATSQDHRHPTNKQVRNNGLCPNTLGQYFGLGSETRHTTTYVPDPYGIEIGNPKDIPDGYEERWFLNVHAIDTRGVVDRMGCTECRCDLYNVTKDEHGQTLNPNYDGGLYCCYDQTQCKVKEGVSSIRRNLYLRYTVKWVDWDDSSIVPVKIYILDVTDTGERLQKDPNNLGALIGCKVEYEVEACGASDVAASNGCIDSKNNSMVMPNGGYVVYGVAHQHTGGKGSALYGEDGGMICSSTPIYGQGKEAGNEADYIVGMSACYPEPGSVKISDGETLLLVSNYSSSRRHTGVMGLFYLLVAEEPPKASQLPAADHERGKVLKPDTWASEVLMGVAVVVVGIGAIVVGVSYVARRNEGEKSGYQSLM